VNTDLAPVRESTGGGKGALIISHSMIRKEKKRKGDGTKCPPGKQKTISQKPREIERSKCPKKRRECQLRSPKKEKTEVKGFTRSPKRKKRKRKRRPQASNFGKEKNPRPKI